MSRGRPKITRTKEELRVFFDKHVEEATDGTGCYLWTAAKNNIGYGFFRYLNGMATAHRAIMDMEGHDIKNKVVYHTCDNYHCVNPAHLRIGTMTDKAQIMKAKGRAGTVCTDPSKYETCPHCGTTTNKLVLGHVHYHKCKQKP